MRLDDAITYFLGQWPAEVQSGGTVRTYTIQLKWLAGFAASRKRVMLADLTPELLRAALGAKLQARGPGSKGGEVAARSVAYAARCLVRWLAAQGVPVADDLKSVRTRKPPERVQPRLYPHEFGALEDAILHRLVDTQRRLPRAMVARDLALIYLLAETGLRASEVCGMEVRNVDFELGAVLVVRGKGGKERALSIVDPEDARGGVTLQLLADWVTTRLTIRNTVRHGMLWTSIKGRPLSPTELRRVLAKLCREAGLPENRPPHAFRRTHFTENYRAQPGSIRVLADRMGWSPKSDHMVNVYTRGAEIDFARTTPVNSVTARWRHGPKVPITDLHPRPITSSGVGPPGGRTQLNEPPLTPRRRVARERPASQTPT